MFRPGPTNDDDGGDRRRETGEETSMSPISVTALANAGAAGEIKPSFLNNLYYFQFGMELRVQPSDCLDGQTTAQIASLLGGQVCKLQPRGLWFGAKPNSSPLPNLPEQNFVSFADQPGAPNPGDLLAVNAADLAQLACQYTTYGLPQAIARELTLAWLIEGSTMSPAAQTALPTSPVAGYPPVGSIGLLYWYTPPTA